MISRRNFIRGLGGLVLASQIPTKLIFDLGHKSHLTGWKSEEDMFLRAVYDINPWYVRYSYMGRQVIIDPKLPDGIILGVSF